MRLSGLSLSNLCGMCLCDPTSGQVYAEAPHIQTPFLLRHHYFLQGLTETTGTNAGVMLTSGPLLKCHSSTMGFHNENFDINTK